MPVIARKRKKGRIKWAVVPQGSTPYHPVHFVRAMTRDKNHYLKSQANERVWFYTEGWGNAKVLH